MKTLKATTKYQLIRNGVKYSTVYNLHREAKETGELLLECGYIKSYEIIPTKAYWLKVK